MPGHQTHEHTKHVIKDAKHTSMQVHHLVDSFLGISLL